MTQKKAIIREPGREASQETKQSRILILDLYSPDCDKINFCHVSQSIYGILLWKPMLTNTLAIQSSRSLSFIQDLFFFEMTIQCHSTQQIVLPLMERQMTYHSPVNEVRKTLDLQAMHMLINTDMSNIPESFQSLPSLVVVQTK